MSSIPKNLEHYLQVNYLAGHIYETEFFEVNKINEAISFAEQVGASVMEIKMIWSPSLKKAKK